MFILVVEEDWVRTNDAKEEDRNETEKRGIQEEEGEEEEESKKYFVDALNMFGRSILLQLSFFIAMIVASRKLPVAGLAAHHLTAQLWLVCSYIVDGFATIGTIYWKQTAFDQID